MTSPTHRLNTVALGLSILYAALIILLLGIIFPFFYMFGLSRGLEWLIPYFYLMTLVPTYALLAFAVLNVIGRFLCLFGPSSGGAKALVGVTLLTDLLTLAVGVLGLLGSQLNPIREVVGPILAPDYPKEMIDLVLLSDLQVLGLGVFLIFLHGLAGYVRNGRLTFLAVFTFCFLLLVVGGLAYDLRTHTISAALVGWMAQMGWSDPSAQAYGVLFLYLVPPALLLIFYGNLLTYLSKALRKYVSGQEPGAAPAAAASATSTV
jgi:hypothetical protein